ncbi:hypothetical protein DNH61_11880 [Paenibacillus sambharensis]|uniref:HIRAN domain-containing protein n=1 Tax=Paenibacillus sambharensis TaxID=1803190 RepID=A0A2W1LJR8_9BACL|nr:hypothetical protein DNH61_11880 [Paenibacillus sambharensis]
METWNGRSLRLRIISSRTQIAKNMRIGDRVVLKREPENSYDIYAIKVLDYEANMLGDIVKEPALSFLLFEDWEYLVYHPDISLFNNKA